MFIPVHLADSSKRARISRTIAMSVESYETKKNLFRRFFVSSLSGFKEKAVTNPLSCYDVNLTQYSLPCGASLNLFPLVCECRENLPTTTLYPTKDADGNPLETEYGLCRFKDHQTVTIQVQLYRGY